MTGNVRFTTFYAWTKQTIFLLLLLVHPVCSSADPSGSSSFARIERAEDSAPLDSTTGERAELSQVRQLELDTEQPKVIWVKVHRGAGVLTPVPGVILKGKYISTDTSLVFSSKRPVPLDQDLRFSIPVPLEKEVTPFHFLSIDPYGKTEKIEFTIKFPELKSWKTRNPPPKQRGRPVSKVSYSAGIGFTSAEYREPLMTPYQLNALTIKGAAVVPLGKGSAQEPTRWDVGASGYVTALPFGRSATESVRFLGLNGRAGYRLTSAASSWQAAIHGGIYYTTMMVSPARFGFQNVGGPQLFPTLRKTLAGGQTISGYFKYSPVSASFSLMSLSSREIAGGGSFQFGKGMLRDWSVTLDVAYLQVDFDQVAVSSQSLTIGVNRGF